MFYECLWPKQSAYQRFCTAEHTFLKWFLKATMTKTKLCFFSAHTSLGDASFILITVTFSIHIWSSGVINKNSTLIQRFSGNCQTVLLTQMTRNSKWKWKQGFVLSECYPIQEFKHTWMTGLPLSSLSPCWAAQSKLHFPKQLIKITGSPGEGSETLTSKPQASTLMKEKTSTAHSLIWVAGMMTDLSVKHIRLQRERERGKESLQIKTMI